MPRCTAILVTYNSSAEIEACLRALAEQECEIVVVDNASEDDTVRRVLEVAESVRLQLVTISRNIGFAAGVNQGARAASGAVLLVLNPDAIAEPGAVSSLLEELASSGAAAVSGSLLGDDGQPDKGFSFRRLPTLSSLLCEALLVNQLWPGNPVNRRFRCLDADYSIPQDVEQPAGACLAVRREVWESLGGMDTAFLPVWFEDVDFCARLAQAGGRIRYRPEARFHHAGAHSVGAMAFRDKQVFWYTNMLRYANKHWSPWKRMVLRAGVVVGMVLRSGASVLGARPKGVALGEALGAYTRVAAIAFEKI